MHEERTPLSSVPAAETILALDNVALALPIAGAGSRVLAGFTDYFFQAILQLVWLVGFFFFGSRFGLDEGWALAAYLLVALVLDWAYFAGTEAVWDGQTPGKKIVGLRTVARDGGAAATSSILIRNLLRPVDLVVGVAMIALDPLGRRLGDRVAGTLVVHDRGAEQGILLRRLPEGWGPQDVAIVESLLARAGQLETGRAEELAGRILRWLERDRPAFLQGVDRRGADLETVRRAFQAESR